jgi:Rieske Fe-S protein
VTSSCPCPSRRAVLGAAGAAVLLTACGGAESSTAEATSAPTDPVIAELEELRAEGALAFQTSDGKAIAIARGDEVVAYSAICTHDGCTVGWDAEDEVIACPCHGSRFDAADGSVVRGPARSALAAVQVEVDEVEGVLRRA